MQLEKDTATLLMLIVAAGWRGLSKKSIETGAALGGVELGAHFDKCLLQLADIGLINITDGVARVWCVKALEERP